MILQELFKVSPKWSTTTQTGTDFEAEFEVGGIHYEFTADKRLYRDAKTMWFIEFRVPTPEWDKRYGLTGTGNASLVLSTVIDIMKHFLHEYPDITQFSFEAEEPSRRKLYARMIRRLLPTWHLEQNPNNAKMFTISQPLLKKS